MNKQEFLEKLRKRLSGLPQEDINERLTFYSEMIDDRIEDGLSETEAVEQIGSIDDIAEQVIADTPVTKIAKEKIKTARRLSAGEIVLLVLGSPIWLSLGIALFAVIFSLYISLWAVIISLWAVFVSFAACFIGGIFACVIFIASSNTVSGIAMLGAGLVCAGLSVFMFYGCKAITKGTLILTKKTAIWIKNCFIGKENA